MNLNFQILDCSDIEVSDMLFDLDPLSVFNLCECSLGYIGQYALLASMQHEQLRLHQASLLTMWNFLGDQRLVA